MQLWACTRPNAEDGGPFHQLLPVSMSSIVRVVVPAIAIRLHKAAGERSSRKDADALPSAAAASVVPH